VGSGRGDWDDAAAGQRQYDPRRYAGGGRGYDDEYVGGARGAGRNPRGGRAPSRRSGGGAAKPVLITLAVLLVVIAVAVVGLVVLPGKINKPAVTIPDSPFATATPGATPTIADTFKAFQSDRSKYSIAYPAAWNATSDERTTQSQYDYIDTFALQNAPSRLLIEQAGAFSAYTDQQILQNEVTNAQQNGVRFTRADSPAPTQKVGGATWARQDYEVNANGIPLDMALLACHHGGWGYVVVLVSSAGEFSNDDQAVFTPMLNSFHFA
jgi:hypothetical protein